MSILVDLLPYFKDKPENIATRGLHSVLKYPEVLSGLRSFLKSRFNWELSIEYVDVQVSQGAGGRPDLVGANSTRESILFCEVKFWAGLTENQPVSYLRELSPGGLLVFIAPKARKAKLWLELRDKLRSDGLLQDDNGFSITQNGTELIRIGQKYLAFVAGTDLLKWLYETAQTAGRKELSCDIYQLQMLWEAYDTPDLPLIDESILNNAELACLINGFANLPTKIADAVIRLPDAARGQRSVAGGVCTWVDNVRIGRLKGWVIYSPPNWKAYGRSPIWFESNNNRQYVPEPATWKAIETEFAKRAGQAKPFASKSGDWPGSIAVPLMIKPNAIETEVVSSIVEQLCSLAKEIENCAGYEITV